MGLKKCVSMLNPGLAPWAMQGYRPYRAHFSESVVLTEMSTLLIGDSALRSFC